MMSFAVESGAGTVAFAEARHLSSYLAAIRARPAYQRALARGGAYSFVSTDF